MSDDLVKRLRQHYASDYVVHGVCDEAADRIEKLETNFQLQLEWYLSNKRVLDDRIKKLEAALRDIINERGICGNCGQLATGEGKRSFVICDKTVLGFQGPCYWTPQDPKDIARKTLEEKDD